MSSSILTRLQGIDSEGDESVWIELWKAMRWDGTHLGMILFASSAVTGHRFAIWAISNWVKSDSLRRVLVALIGPREVRGVEYGRTLE